MIRAYVVRIDGGRQLKIRAIGPKLAAQKHARRSRTPHRYEVKTADGYWLAYDWNGRLLTPLGRV